ncbi:hypothetical protein BOTBODRAFT_185399 [Botryobasidium botryosum FD-172 SS1]|uniref:Late embryogenesis abundant protein LEA-2 subgroup domain-containing protein n=1 Tax=Botryobasidium botryosum (strain FD-172 SS1) TaxID=930990 RepID=A0A067MQH4_BOTB1|nr:hypothetical protein BOTBODRAFT_185399 [Botryobasidium botryosum FD-172 SS1]
MDQHAHEQQRPPMRSDYYSDSNPPGASYGYYDASAAEFSDPYVQPAYSSQNVAQGSKQTHFNTSGAGKEFRPSTGQSSGVNFAPPKSTGDLRLWRQDEHGKMWTKGSRPRVFCRFLCCTLMTIVFLIVSIALALAMWLRPPDINFNGVQVPTNGSAVVPTANSLLINLGLSIGVQNPNYFSASFQSITAAAFYPLVPNTQIGGGAVDNIVFKSHSNTNFLFPFQIDYSTSKDPQGVIIKDIVQRCGLTGGAKSPVPVKYSLQVKLKILFVTISPTFNGNANFACPLTLADVKALSGLDLGSLLGAAT